MKWVLQCKEYQYLETLKCFAMLLLTLQANLCVNSTLPFHIVL